MINPDVIANLKMLQDAGNPGLLQNLVGIFRRRIPELMKDIDDAISRSEADLIARRAHDLKSSCGNLGALAMAQIAKALEIEAKNQNFSEARTLLDKLGKEFQMAEQELIQLTA